MRSERWPRIPSAVWIPFLASRALVWLAGVLAMVLEGEYRPFDPTGLTTRLGHTANILLAPAVRWDAVWYVYIAQHGYNHGALPSFFPLYPEAIGAVSWSDASAITAGVVISLLAFLAALAFLYRLVELDFGPRSALATVWLVALFPMSLFFSAVYTESLFLALSAGSLYLARRDRWVWAGVLGALATAARSLGLILVVPLAILYVHERPPTGRGWPARRGWGDWRGALWIALVPAGLVGYMMGLGVAQGTPFAMLDAAPASRGLVFFPVTIIRQLRWTADRFGSYISAGHDVPAVLQSGIPELAFLALAVVCAVGMIRRMRPAYVAYTIVTLLVLLSEPDVKTDPLTSFPRYILVLFPLWVWLAVAAHERRAWRWLLVASGLLLVLFSARFSTWHFVA